MQSLKTIIVPFVCYEWYVISIYEAGLNFKARMLLALCFSLL